MVASPIPSQTLFTFCAICECRLHTPEEWCDGRCAFHARETPRPITVDPDWDAILAWIDSYTAAPDVPPTGVIRYPNRRA